MVGNIHILITCQNPVFGIPELHRDKIKNAQLVSCPGCMAVTSTLALYPLIKNDLIDTEHIIVDSKIGSSGAGAGGTSGTQHAMRAGVIRPYKPAKHRHTGEIEQELSESCWKKNQSFNEPTCSRYSSRNSLYESYILEKES